MSSGSLSDIRMSSRGILMPSRANRPFIGDRLIPMLYRNFRQLQLPHADPVFVLAYWYMLIPGLSSFFPSTSCLNSGEGGFDHALWAIRLSMLSSSRGRSDGTRSSMLMCHTGTLESVVAFPKSKNSGCIGAPTVVYVARILQDGGLTSASS